MVDSITFFWCGPVAAASFESTMRRCCSHGSWTNLAGSTTVVFFRVDLARVVSETHLTGSTQIKQNLLLSESTLPDFSPCLICQGRLEKSLISIWVDPAAFVHQSTLRQCCPSLAFHDFLVNVGLDSKYHFADCQKTHGAINKAFRENLPRTKQQQLLRHIPRNFPINLPRSLHWNQPYMNNSMEPYLETTKENANTTNAGERKTHNIRRHYMKNQRTSWHCKLSKISKLVRHEPQCTEPATN